MNVITRRRLVIVATEVNDYSTGIPRRHHNLYIEDGNLVIQVEKAIFKVHRSFLAKYSSVIKDMLEAPKSNKGADGTDENPLVLTGDSVSSWETFLGSHYDSATLLDPTNLTNQLLLAILPLAHKYCMEAVEEIIIKKLSVTRTTEEWVGLMVASQILSSKPLYDQALKGLQKNRLPNSEQARRIGFDAYLAIMEGLQVRCHHCSREHRVT